MTDPQLLAAAVAALVVVAIALWPNARRSK